MKKVNLEEILIKQFDRFGNFDSKEDVITGLKEDAESSVEIIINAMREACTKTLELAAEEQAKYYSELGFTSTGKKINDSILKLKEQII